MREQQLPEHIQNRWPLVLELLKGEVGEKDFGKWIKPVRLVGVKGNQFILEAPNAFIKNWLNLNFDKTLKKSLGTVYREEMGKSGTPQVDILVGAGASAGSDVGPLFKVEPQKTKPAAKPRLMMNQTQGKNLTFDNFVVGPSNQFVHAAALAVADAPGEIYNPLFIYGGVGLGKTHILNSIAHRVQEKFPMARVCYQSSERFINNLINALRLKKMDEFRRRYRNGCDILLIDDIQFIGGKERSQEEFFHTYNTLYELKKQIVLSSDRFPKDIPGLEERLRSRFEAGLIADIKAPDLETRVAILKSKAQEAGFEIPNDVALFVAGAIRHNIRELEGSLTRLTAYSSLMGRTIDLPFAQEVFKDLVKQEVKLGVEEIQRVVANSFNLKVSDLKSDRKFKQIALPRQIAMYLSRKLTDSSFPDIGAKFGGKDHSTVLHAVRKIEGRLSEDTSLRNTIESIEKTIHVDTL